METVNKIGQMFVSKRFKSFYWHTAMMFVAGLLDLIVQSLAGLNLPNEVTVVLGLVLGQVSKYLNTKSNEDREN